MNTELISLFSIYIIGGLPFGYLYASFIIYSSAKQINTKNNYDSVSTFNTTNSLKHGVVVLCLDIFKGYIITRYANYILPVTIQTELIAFTLTLGHCFPIWHAKIKGGKGLTTAGGALIFINPATVIFWITFWFFLRNRISDLALQNLFALIATILALIGKDILSANIINSQTLTLLPLALLLILTHADPLRKYLNTIK